MLSIGLCDQWKRWIPIQFIKSCASNKQWTLVCVVGLQPTRLTPPHFECGMFSNFITRRYSSQADFLPHSYFQHQLVNDVVNPNPFIMPNRLTGAPYLALGNYAIYAYLIYLTHVPYTIVDVHQTPFNYCFRRSLSSPNIKSGLDQSSDCDYRGSLRSTIIFTFSIIPYLILFVKHYFSYTNNQ